MTTVAQKPISANHLFFYYKDLKQAQHFYEKILGLERVLDYGYASIHQISATTFIGLVDETKGMPQPGLPKTVTLSFITTEVDGWYQYLTDHQVPLQHSLADATRHPTRGFVALDPEGYFLEFETFLSHAQNEKLQAKLGKTTAFYPGSAQTAVRPHHLGIQGNVLWLYYDDVAMAQRFYEQVMGLSLLVDQGFAKVYGSSATGFVGLVDGAQGLHSFNEEKAVTVAFFTSAINPWFEQFKQAQARLRTPAILIENETVSLFVAYDVGGYLLEFDTFLDCEPNQKLLSRLL